MKKTKLFKKIIIAGVLLSAGITALTCLNSQTVAAKSLPVATTKDYNKLQKLSKKSGVHYIKKENGTLVLFQATMLKRIVILNH
ncbi:MAG: hypothetical protein M3Z87_05870 [Lactobacillus sp.]|nr:hypothetical protein [Lactobacillus sp.]